ncbi:hypothetical protein PQX77_021476 [Marasmius sp. AFHP31]|nr:hypothetical protein PQX77_021476 [Marasmius sp. AFHP31]
MSNSTYFANAQGTIIGPNADFRTVHGDAITNHNSYQCTHAEDRVVLYGKTYRRIMDGDINIRRQLTSKVISVTIKPEGVSTARTSAKSQVVQVRKTTQTAEVTGFGGMFTLTTYESVNENDDGFKFVLDCVQKAAMSLRSPFLPQLFGFSGPNLSTMIAYDELANGSEYSHHFRGRNWTVFYYLNYTLWVAINSLREDKAMVFPVSSQYFLVLATSDSGQVVNGFRNWSLNLKTLSWHYDPASVALNPLSEKNLIPYPSDFPPLHQTLQQLNTAGIVACVEETFGDVLCLVGTSNGREIGNLSGFAKHGVLTFGAIIDLNKAGILAHFPSTPPLKWFCKSKHPDVKASFSSSVPWRLDFSFCKPGDFRVTLNISWHIPTKDCTQLQNAYLCQSLHFLNNCEDVRDVVYVDEVGFQLKATFHYNPMTSSTPAYLFVPPPPIEIIHNMRCVQYPFPNPLFYWSCDPQGEQIIAEENWEEFGIPKLEIEDFVGSYWTSDEYAFVQEHLMSTNYNLDGRRYAQEHGYPELIYGK